MVCRHCACMHLFQQCDCAVGDVPVSTEPNIHNWWQHGLPLQWKTTVGHSLHSMLHSSGLSTSVVHLQLLHCQKTQSIASLGCFPGLHAGRECMLAHHGLHPLVEGSPVLASEDPAANSKLECHKPCCRQHCAGVCCGETTLDFSWMCSAMNFMQVDVLRLCQNVTLYLHTSRAYYGAGHRA